MKCCVCGSEKDIHVCSSRFAPMSSAYCEDCLRQGKENYNILVSYYSCAGEKMEDFNEGYRNEAIRQLQMHDKTIEQFELDLKQLNERMNEVCQYHDEYIEEYENDSSGK